MSRNSTPRARRVSTARDDVVGGQRHVLGAGAAVEVEELVDLRALLADRGLVERELDAVVAAGDDLAHQRRVLGGDVVADELGHVGEAHDAVVEADPLVHPAQLDVAHHVVERLEQPPRRALRAGRARTGARRSRAGRGRCSGSGRRGCAGCRRRWRWRPGGRCRARRSGRAVPRRPSRPVPGRWAMHRSTSGTSRAMSTMPSPWRRWWSSSGLLGSTPPLSTNRTAPLHRTKAWWSRLPVSGPE